MKAKKPKLYYIANLLITFSITGIFVTLFPIAKLYLFPPHIEHSIHDKGYFITIPKIEAQASIVDDVNPWDEKSYLAALHHGIAHAAHTSAPGKSGMGYYFAHSSGPPWEDTFFNTVFLRLGELSRGDEIFISKDGKVYTYLVTKKIEVWPDQVQAVLGEKKTEIIFQTCTPIGTSLKRLLVFAVPTSPK